MSAASSSAYYTDIHVRPQLAVAEGDLVSRVQEPTRDA